MSSRKRDTSTGSDSQLQNCVVCLGVPKFPTGRPDACNHLFCFLCINNWVKRRSECPLCKCKAKFIVKTSATGKVTNVKVKERTEAHFSHELANADADTEQTVVDITVAFAVCRVCHRSDNADRLLLCDGTVGQEFDGTPIRCNAAYHCYCLPEPLVEVPRGRWYCPFCADMRATQRGVYNRRYAPPRTPTPIPVVDLVDLDDEPGPSRRRVLPRRQPVIIEDDDDDESFSEEFSSSEETEQSGGSSVVAVDENEESEASFTTNSDGSVLTGDEEDWENIDNYVLELPDTDYVPDGPRTTVQRRAKRKKPAKRKGIAKKKRKTPAKKKTEKKPRVGIKKKRTKRKRKKNVSQGQRRLAQALGIDPEAPSIPKKQKKDRYPSDGIARGKFGAPLLSLVSGKYDELPIQEDYGHKVFRETTNSELKFVCGQQGENSGDLIGSIMFEQTKTLAPARYQKVGRDGKIIETDMMTEHRKRIDEKLAKSQAFCEFKVMNATVFKTDDPGNRLNNRKSRPSRWGSPMPSNDLATNTASIPLPSGPPVPQATPLEFIPIPQPNVIRTPITSGISLNNRPSALNTSPSTSFSLNAFASPLPSFNMSAAQLGPQAGVHSLGPVSVPQLPISSQLFPGLLMQPQLTLGTVNDLLAAGLLGNPTLAAPPMSQASSFVLGQLGSQGHDITQQLANLASSLNPLGTHPQRLPVGAVPPPPPAASDIKPEVELSISKPLAEKIRQIAESNELRPLAESNQSFEKKQENKDIDETRHNESGRKSASAEEEEEEGEETSDADVKLTSSKGPMFDQARKMLSSSLKKIFKKRLITKDEYKMIMKKGVTALSQRTRLDQEKVDDYANKYVQCVVHRRKKKH